MATNTPIYSIAKELNIDSNRIILACKSIGISAKGATKQLNEEEEKIPRWRGPGWEEEEEDASLSAVHEEEEKIVHCWRGSGWEEKEQILWCFFKLRKLKKNTVVEKIIIGS